MSPIAQGESLVFFLLAIFFFFTDHYPKSATIGENWNKNWAVNQKPLPSGLRLFFTTDQCISLPAHFVKHFTSIHEQHCKRLDLYLGKRPAFKCQVARRRFHAENRTLWREIPAAHTWVQTMPACLKFLVCTGLQNVASSAKTQTSGNTGNIPIKVSIPARCTVQFDLVIGDHSTS